MFQETEEGFMEATDRSRQTRDALNVVVAVDVDPEVVRSSSALPRHQLATLLQANRCRENEEHQC